MKIYSPSQEEIFHLIWEVRLSVYNLAGINISKAQAWQTEHYDLKLKGTLLSVGNKVTKFNTQADKRKGNKLASRWLVTYTVVGVHKNVSVTVADANGKMRVAKVCTSQSE